MFSIGLTGNVAAGKSTVASWFAEWGATLIDADGLVREVEEPGSPVVAKLAERFGADIVMSDGSLDRGTLRRRVMGDEQALTAINGIVHPAVRRLRAARLAEAEARGDRIVVSDIPLLFEAADPDAFDLVVLVDVPVDVRHARLTTGRGLSGTEADRLMESQLPSDTKRSRSDIVIENAGTLAALREEAWRAWTRIQERAADRERDAPTGTSLRPRPGS